MKRLAPGNDHMHTLKITVELFDPSVTCKHKKSDEWLKNLNDLVRSIIGSLQGRGFHILKAKPSKKSYTYYIVFQPVDKNGDLWDTELSLQLELRDHVSSTHSDKGSITKDLIVKTYYLEDKSYKGMLALLRELWRIFDRLQDGDFSAFTE